MDALGIIAGIQDEAIGEADAKITFQQGPGLLLERGDHVLREIFGGAVDDHTEGDLSFLGRGQDRDAENEEQAESGHCKSLCSK